MSDNSADAIFTILTNIQKQLQKHTVAMGLLEQKIDNLYDHLEITFHDNRSPFYFCQVREDPTIELRLISMFIYHPICVVCSGGDTALALARIGMKEIDAVDISVPQLQLASLKLAVLETHPLDAKSILMDGVPDPRKFLESLDMEKYRLDKKFWATQYHNLATGINRCGRYEQLFRDFVASGFKPDCWEPDNLVKIFGVDAVQYTTKSFGEHFLQVLEKYKQQKDQVETNHFYSSIMLDKYTQDMPYYLQYGANKINGNISFIHNNLLSHLEGKPDGYYRMVSTSNITDWMSQKDIAKLINEIYRVLDEFGIVVMRRLLSDNHLAPHLKKFRRVIKMDDRSWFYTEVLVCYKS